MDMQKRSLALALAGVLMLGIGTTQVVAGGKHSHKVPVKHYFVEIVTAPGDVNGAYVDCPGGYTATGGGTDYQEGLGVIASSGFGGFIDSYFALIDNFGSTLTARHTVEVACVKGTKPAKGRIATEAATDARMEARITALKEAHRAE
jgi:hypothetical protein